MAKEKRESRTRNFATIVYPESAIENWREVISDLHITFLVSPLHDKDVNPDGEIKKPHYHVLFIFDSVKTNSQFLEIVDSIKAVGIEKVASLRGYARYLCHLDNPEKYQYNPDDVFASGADYRELIGLPTDKYTVIREIIEYIDNEQILFYSDIFDYASKNNEAWFRVLCDNGTYVIKEYLKSKSYKIRLDNVNNMC